MKNTLKKITTVILSAAMISAAATVSLTAGAAEKKSIEISENAAYSSVKEKLGTTSRYLSSLGTPCVGTLNGEWVVVGLGRYGSLDSNTAEDYYSNVKDYVTQTGSAKLSETKSTENSRVIAALSAIGKNAADVAGYNLLSPLADFDFVTYQGVNGPVWTLIAIDTFGYDIPSDENVSNQTTREKLVQYILDSSLQSGGWTFFGSADPDMTGMAIQALAPYYTVNPEVKEAVDKALDVMSAQQRDDGGFASWGTVNVESTAQILTALTSIGIDPETDSRFIKNGNTLIDAVMSFSVDNGFSHTQNSSYSQMATEQAFYALVSYDRLKNGKTPLYDMSDIKYGRYDINGDGVFNVTDATFIQKYSADLITLTDIELAKADCNKDGAVNILDATMLQKILVK